MIPYRNTNKGLLKMIIVLFIILILLAVLGLNLRQIVGSQTFQDNWGFVRDTALMIWNNFLKGPLGYFWNTIFVPLIWNPIIHNAAQQASTTPPVTASVGQ